MEKYWIRKTVPFYESVKSCKITLTEYLSGIMINIRKTRKECTGPVWGGCAKNVMKVIKNKTIYTGNGVIEDGFVRYEKTIAEVGSMQNFVSSEEDEIVEVEEEDSFWTKLKRKVFRTNREKVRHLFRRRIVNSLQDKVRSTDTARQLAHKAEDAGTMSLTALTGLYEEARYSEHEITNEQWKLIRQEKGKG